MMLVRSGVALPNVNKARRFGKPAKDRIDSLGRDGVSKMTAISRFSSAIGAFLHALICGVCTNDVVDYITIVTMSRTRIEAM